MMEYGHGGDIYRNRNVEQERTEEFTDTLMTAAMKLTGAMP